MGEIPKFGLGGLMGGGVPLYPRYGADIEVFKRGQDLVQVRTSNVISQQPLQIIFQEDGVMLDKIFVNQEAMSLIIAKYLELTLRGKIG